ncbi:MAG: T9SS type A sorting domain-containing protein [Candidatus Marinimicrobia bacterium]|nr:T9SS type A sorting domain-containing protein [Candidatus Neomarinimicrobiota bacterium]
MHNSSPVVMDYRAFLLQSVGRIIPYFFVVTFASGQFAPTIGEISVLGIRVSFVPDEDITTTGNGSFLTSLDIVRCGAYVIDPPPHDKKYFEDQLKAVDSYFRSVSKENLWLNWSIFPEANDSSYQVDNVMKYYYPFGDEVLQDQRLAEFFGSSLEQAFDTDSIYFDSYDVVVIFHAGIGQDFALPFLDPTPEDIPSTYIDSDFLSKQLGIDKIVFDDGSSVSSGIILPETQNHLLYDIGDDIFAGAAQPCDFQFGLTGTFALMMGFAIGLPPLWNVENGQSGVGVFALMDQGSNNGRGLIPAPPDAWTRMYAGWESSTTMKPTTDISLIKRDSLENQIVKVDINGSEYFLVENRNNWISGEADIDSLRWKNRDDSGVMPPYVQILFDSVAVEIDSVTGVITSVPNYDIGLPNSGLLIWHVDEDKISEGQGSYEVNSDREHRGIDLEEADGAQDIGYISISPFFDPSIGLWSDMWFASNSEYFYANPGFKKEQLLSFGPDTYPNTRSNNGADSFIEINNISDAGKIMTFSVENSLLADGFPDTSLNIHFFYDFTGDGVPDIIGGQDSLWWSFSDSFDPVPFYKLQSNSFQLCVTNYHRYPILALVESVGDSLVVLMFQKSDNGIFGVLWTKSIKASPPNRIYGAPDSQMVVLDYLDSWAYVTEDLVQWHEPLIIVDSLYAATEAFWSFTDAVSSEIDSGSVGAQVGGGIFIFSDAIQSLGLEHIVFSTISLADIDLDGSPEILSTDKDGFVYAINTNFTFESGFPVELNTTSLVLTRDLYGDEHPEVVVQIENGDVVVLDWQGREQYRLSNPKESELRMLSQYKGRNCIATESSIWLFDEATETNSNEWPYIHHDPSNRRIFKTTLEFKTSDESKLIDTKRTYNYPNPAENGETTLRVFVESAEKVEINIYDLAGYFVKRFRMDAPIQGEVNEVVWDVTNVESGVYFANIMAIKGSKSENKILKIAVVH